MESCRNPERISKILCANCPNRESQICARCDEVTVTYLDKMLPIGKTANSDAVARGKVETSTRGPGPLLAAAGGFLDAFTYVGHGHVFANTMTGNMVLLGIHCLSGSWHTGLRHLPPIIGFLFGISAAKALQAHFLTSRIRKPYVLALALEVCILVVISLLPGSTADIWITTSIAFAASVQVESFRQMHGHSFNSTFMTGNLRAWGEGVFHYFFGEDRVGAAQVVRDFSLICGAFLVGAIAGANAVGRFGNRALWFDIALLLFVAALVWPRSGAVNEQAD
jgi:uncharacterized membrane protein YoaK (UPF0700 family)